VQRLWRRGKKEEHLTDLELRIFGKFVGKLVWLVVNCWPDLALSVVNLASKNHGAALGDLKSINKVIELLHNRPSVVCYRMIGPKEDFMIIGYSDVSYSNTTRPISGQLVLIGNKKTAKVCAVSCKGHFITLACMSSKDAEARDLSLCTLSATQVARALEPWVFGTSENKIKTKFYTDSVPTLESIASLKGVAHKEMARELKYLGDKI